jgi:hypothetical protein
VLDSQAGFACGSMVFFIADQTQSRGTQYPHRPFRGFRSFRDVRGPNAHRITPVIAQVQTGLIRRETLFAADLLCHNHVGFQYYFNSLYLPRFY